MTFKRLNETEKALKIAIPEFEIQKAKGTNAEKYALTKVKSAGCANFSTNDVQTPEERATLLEFPKKHSTVVRVFASWIVFARGYDYAKNRK